jgi:uncharacterized protein YhfF
VSGAPEDWGTLDTFAFGDNPALAEKLAQLVRAGKKTATCWAAAEGALTYVGERIVMLDGSGRPRAVLETVELTQRRYDEVHAAFAHDEREDDRTLESCAEPTATTSPARGSSLRR